MCDVERRELQEQVGGACDFGHLRCGGVWLVTQVYTCVLYHVRSLSRGSWRVNSPELMAIPWRADALTLSLSAEARGELTGRHTLSRVKPSIDPPRECNILCTHRGPVLARDGESGRCRPRASHTLRHAGPERSKKVQVRPSSPTMAHSSLCIVYGRRHSPPAAPTWQTLRAAHRLRRRLILRAPTWPP